MNNGARQTLSGTFLGGCHCGEVRFEVDLHEAAAVRCNCSICAKKGYLHLIVEASAFRLLRGGDNLTTYRFNTGLAAHTFCRTCGVQAFYTPRSHPDGVSVNGRCLDDVDAETLATRDFDGRNWESARAGLDPA